MNGGFGRLRSAETAGGRFATSAAGGGGGPTGACRKADECRDSDVGEILDFSNLSID